MRIILCGLFSLTAWGQITTPSTTLTSPIGINSNAQWCLASGTSVVLPSTGANGSLLLVDREVAQVTRAGSPSGCFIVKRGQMGTSASVAHNAAALVWIGQPATSSGDPSRPFNGAFITSLPTGACVAEDQFTLPVFFVGTGSFGVQPGTGYNCISGAWSPVGVLHVTGFTGLFSGILVDAFGATPADVFGQRALGTPQAPTALTSGNIFFRIGGGGYRATGYSPLASSNMSYVATENWSDTATGSRIEFATTPNASTTRATNWYIENTGDLIPATTTKNIGSAALPVLKASLSNCTSGASPAVCGANTVGAVAVAAAATTLVVNTTAVTAKSRITISMDASLGSDLSVTCNIANIAAWVSARSAGTSFTITTASGPVTNPMCLSYHIFN